MDRARVLLADDHSLLANTLADMLRDDVDLVGIVSDGHALVDAAKRLRPDVIIADIDMPAGGGLEALRQLRLQNITIRMLILTAHADPHLAASAVRAGAAGFVLKHMACAELPTAIREALAGRVYVSPSIAEPNPRR